jgi:hypothetical protein
MKTILPWILVVAFAAGAGALYFSNSAKDAELAKAREQSQEADALRTQLDDSQKQLASQNDQIESMRKDNEELLRLRNEVRQMRDQNQQISKQLQSSQAQIARSQQEIQQVQAKVNENANTIAEQRILQMKQNQQATGTCINNLHLLDGAKQQWALEHNKTADAVPTMPEIAVYLPNHQPPQCPNGGAYTLNAVSNAPTCSIPGHSL